MKYKVKTVDCQLIVKAKTSFKDTIEESELDRFTRIYLRGFLKPKLIRSGVIEYSGPVGISLYDRLRKPVTKRDFLFMMEQISVAVQKLEANRLYLKYVVLDIHNVFINEVTKEKQFIYLPLKSVDNTNNIVTFIESIVYSVKPAEEKDTEYVSRFIYSFQAMQPFDAKALEQYIAKEDRSVVNTIQKQNMNQSGFMTDKQQHYYQHYDQKNQDNDDEATGLLQEDDDEATGLLVEEDDEATGLLVEDDDEATGLLEENREYVHYPTLYRVLIDENIQINKPVFRIGKERSYVDYFVGNNIAVSRNHADIITRGSQYFIKDLNSKNHTYVNSQMIPAQTEIEIHDGDHIRLGNEEFVFNVWC